MSFAALSPASARTDIVLVGAGHAHVHVLRSFAMHKMQALRLTLVSRGREMVYSGMLPGRVAGHYSHEECVVDLDRLCRAAGARLIDRSAIGLDCAGRLVLVENGPSVGYDIASLDIGIAPKLDTIAGADRHAIAVKPIADFEAKWLELEARCKRPDGPRRILVVGGGAAGFELILAIRQALIGKGQADKVHGDEVSPRDFSFTLLSGKEFLGEPNRAARRAAAEVLRERGVRLVTGRSAVAIDAQGLHLDDGFFLKGDAIIVATQAQAAPWLAQTALSLDAEGFVAIRQTLQSRGDGDVFAAGDCAGMIEHPRPKAGVFAVRQGPVLAENLRRHAGGRKLLRYLPQKRALMLLGLGDDEAIACWGPLAARGRYLWRLKQHIDRRWIGQYQRIGAGAAQ